MWLSAERYFVHLTNATFHTLGVVAYLIKIYSEFISTFNTNIH